MHDPSREGFEFADHQPIRRENVKYGHSLSHPQTWQKDKLYAFHQAVVARYLLFVCILNES